MGHLTKTKASRLSAATRPVVEQLEKRQLLSVTLTDGTLAIVGTEAADTIEIYPSTKVSDRLIVNVNGVAKRYALSAVQRIQVDALGGDDRVNVSSLAGLITVPVTLQGGAGNDTLAGALGDDLIMGGDGADFISGGGGNDVLSGGRGKDRILGGEGNDTINGGLGSDDISTDQYADNSKDVVLPSKGKDSLNSQAKPNFPISTYTGTIEAYSPQQIRRAYGFGDLSDKNYTNRGQGQAIAIIGAYHAPTAKADLAYFSKQFGLPAPTKKTFMQVYASGKKPTEDAGWSSEVLMDIQWAHAIAPAATIILVEADSALKSDIYAAIPTAVKLLNKYFGGGIVSMSLGGVEVADQVQLDSVFNNRKTKNISFVAAAGDTPEPSYPATSPYVLAVGGTSLYLDEYGNRVAGDNVTTININGSKQMPWGYTDSEWELLGYGTLPVPGGERPWILGGGGPSAVYGQPAYQANRGVNYGGIIDPVTGQIRYTRGTPDISWAADPRPFVHTQLDVSNGGGGTGGTGNGGEFFQVDDDLAIGCGAVAVFNSYGNGGRSGWFATGGTSEGAPQVAAMIALANQVRAERKLPKLGNTLVPTIYRLGQRGGDQYFHDVELGGTNWDSANSLFLTSAYTGWDYATGFGTPNAASLIPALAGIKTPTVNKKGTITGMFTTYNPLTTGNIGSSPLTYIQFKGQVTFQGANTITLSPPTITQIFNSSTTTSTSGTVTQPPLRIYIYGADIDDYTLLDASDYHVIGRNQNPITLYRNGNQVYGVARFEVVDTTGGNNGGGNGGGGNNGATGNRLYGNFKIVGTIKGRDKIDLNMYSIDKNGNAIKNAWTPYRTAPTSIPATYVKGTIKT